LDTECPTFLTEIKKYLSGDDEIIKKIIPIITERINVFEDIEEMKKAGELDYFFNQPEYDAKNLLWKQDNDLKVSAEHLKKVINLLEKISEDNFTQDEIKKAVWEYATEVGRGSVLWPMRYALSGRDKSPDPFQLAEVLGKDETINRINNAINKIAG
jgi:glutamyl/glutaminyl-tRNA synthetase